MLIYFEFLDKRRKAHLTWSRSEEKMIVHLAETQLTSIFPEDLFFTIDASEKVNFEAEDIKNLKLLELQNVLRKRLQEIVSAG